MQSEGRTKRCGKCGETKPVAEFYRNKTTRDGLQYACKVCWLAMCERRRRTLGMKVRHGPPRKGRFYDLPTGHKYCAKCQTIKSEDNFHLVRSDGQERFAWCKPCALADQERRRRAKGIKPKVDTSGTKRCPRCGVTKAVTEFARDPRRPRGINSYCFPCYRAYARELGKKNRATALRRQRRKRASGPGKHQLAAEIVGRAIKLGILTRGPCTVCGTTESIQAHHTDYTKPLEVTWLCRLHHFHAHGQLLDQTE